MLLNIGVSSNSSGNRCHLSWQSCDPWRRAVGGVIVGRRAVLTLRAVQDWSDNREGFNITLARSDVYHSSQSSGCNRNPTVGLSSLFRHKPQVFYQGYHCSLIIGVLPIIVTIRVLM